MMIMSARRKFSLSLSQRCKIHPKVFEIPPEVSDIRPEVSEIQSEVLDIQPDVLQPEQVDQEEIKMEELCEINLHLSESEEEA